MQQMCKLFTDPDSNQPNAFTEVLHFLSDEIISKTSDFETWHKATEGQGQRNDLDSDRVCEFSEKIEQLISSILLVVQKQSKHHVAMETESVDDNAKEDAEGKRIVVHFMFILLRKRRCWKSNFCVLLFSLDVN